MVVSKFVFLSLPLPLNERSIDRGNSSDFVMVVLMVVVTLVFWRPRTLSFITLSLPLDSVAVIVMLTTIEVWIMVMVTYMVVVVSKRRRGW